MFCFIPVIDVVRLHKNEQTIYYWANKWKLDIEDAELFGFFAIRSCHLMRNIKPSALKKVLLQILRTILDFFWGVHPTGGGRINGQKFQLSLLVSLCSNKNCEPYVFDWCLVSFFWYVSVFLTTFSSDIIQVFQNERNYSVSRHRHTKLFGIFETPSNQSALEAKDAS